MLDIGALLNQAVNIGASDIHISVGASPKFRIHGQLVDTKYQRMTASDTLEVLLSLMSTEQREVFDREGEIDLSVSVEGSGRCRVSAYKQKGSISLALRLVDNNIPDWSSLEIPEEIMKLCREKKGLVMVTGPSGSGKSTVLASMIDSINSDRACSILTLEDPIEYLHIHKKSIIDQREIGLDAKNYLCALSSALHQDADVLQVGHLRQEEEFSTLLLAAETGRLVFSSMYTIGAVETLENIINAFAEQRRAVARNRLACSLRATVSRQLVTGVDGSRVPAYEVMLVDNSIRGSIRDGDLYDIDSYIKDGADRGMVTMDDYLLRLFNSGRITAKVAIEAAHDAEGMERALGG